MPFSRNIAVHSTSCLPKNIGRAMALPAQPLAMPCVQWWGAGRLSTHSDNGQMNRSKMIVHWHCTKLFHEYAHNDLYMYVPIYDQYYTIFPQEYYWLAYLSTTEWTSTKLIILIIVPTSWHLCLVSQKWYIIYAHTWKGWGPQLPRPRMALRPRC